MFFSFGKKEPKVLPKTLFEALADPSLKRGSFEFFMGPQRFRPAKQQFLTADSKESNPESRGDVFIYEGARWRKWETAIINISWNIKTPVRPLFDDKGKLVCLYASNPHRDGYIPIRLVFYLSHRIPKKRSQLQIIAWTDEEDPVIVGF